MISVEDIATFFTENSFSDFVSWAVGGITYAIFMPAIIAASGLAFAAVLALQGFPFVAAWIRRIRSGASR